jgi:predicted nuclease of predicted toxin-antitoxin system
LKILLDENFPMTLYRRLRLAGYDVEHIIALGQRGLPDASIIGRLREEELLFLTQDDDFENISSTYSGTIIISRIRQSSPIKKRTEIWLYAIEKFLIERPTGKLFDLLETGELVPVLFQDLQ